MEEKMKYIIASDYDGTISRHGVISDKTIKGIKEFKERGNMFGLVTGRDYVNGFLELKENADLQFDFLIMSNGASACDKDGNIYFSEKINGNILYGETTLAQELVKRCLELTSCPCNISFEKSRLTVYPDYSFEESNSGTKHRDYLKLEEIGDFVSASAICDTAEQATIVSKILKEEFGQYLNPLQNGRCIDISPIGVDKSVGIERLAKQLNLPCEQIWTIGDNYNDMTMLKKYHGCAMLNGVKEILSVAEYACEDVSDVVKIILEK